MENHLNIANHELAQKLIDSSIDRLMAIDLNWNFIAWNKTSELLSGFRKDEVLGKHLLEIYPDVKQDEEMMTAIAQAFHGRKSFLGSHTAYPLRSYVEHHFIPLTNSDGEMTGVMNIMHDVAYRIKAEKN